MNTNKSTSFLTAAVFTAAVAALLSGCGSAGIGDVFGNGRDHGRDGRYNRAGEIRGTVERVDTRDRYIVVNREDSDSRYGLRNSDDDRYGNNRYEGDEVVLYYDDATKVEHEGRDYRPQDLEPGDRIAAEVQRTGDRLIVEDIDVLYDASTGVGDDDRYGRYDRNRDDLGAADVRGTVRYVDTRERTLEIEPTEWGNDFSTGRSRSYGDRVLVRYDSQTLVEYEGQRYGPENIDRGDVVEIEVRDLGQQLLAEEIRVVRDSRSVTRR